MVVLSILMFPSMVIRYNVGCARCCSSTCLVLRTSVLGRNFYTWSASANPPRRLTGSLPFLMSIGIGLSTNNTRAVFEALFNRQSSSADEMRIEGDADGGLAEMPGSRSRFSLGDWPSGASPDGVLRWHQIYGTLPFLVPDRLHSS